MPMTIRSGIKILLGLAIGLPVLQTLLYWVSGLLAAMGDEAAANFFQRFNLGTAVLWLVSLVGLIVLLGAHAVSDPRLVHDEIDETPL
jgi:hypothetical protein